MQISIGISKKADVTAAIEEVSAKVVNPSMLIMLSSYEHLSKATQILSQKYAGVPMIGTSATTYEGSESSDKRMVLIGFGKDIVGEVGVIRNLSTAPMIDIPKMEENIAKVQAGVGNTICLEFCTNDEERLVTTMNVALEHAGIPVAGGTVFGVPEGASSMVMVNGVLYQDACAYAIIKNQTGKIRTYSELIFKPMEGAKKHIATGVKLDTKELLTLDGRPAASVYCEDAGVSESELVGNVLTNPLGRVIGDQVFIASPYQIGKNGSLINYKRINENDTISVMELEDYEAVGAQTRATITQENSKISFVFSINCIYRHLLYTDRGYLNTFLGEMAKLGPHIGVVGGGEQLGKQHVNQTMVCVVFE